MVSIWTSLKFYHLVGRVNCISFPSQGHQNLGSHSKGISFHHVMKNSMSYRHYLSLFTNYATDPKTL